MTTADAGFDDRIVGGGFRPAAPLAIAVCGGILITLGADILDRPDLGFDEWADRQFDSIPGFTPQAPPIEEPGYGVETFDDIQVVTSDNVGQQLNEKGFMRGIPDGQVELFVLKPEGYNELRDALLKVNQLQGQGLTQEEATEVILKQKPYLEGPLVELASKAASSGRTVVVTDPGVTGAIRFRPNGDVEIL